LIGLVLNKKFRVGVTQGNLNNHIGVPLTLLSMNENTEIGIVEMGANHPGEIDQLCRIAEPDFGLITNIGKAHLHGFGSFEGVIQTKTELYRFVEKRGGIIFFNSDNELLVNLTKRNNKTISYGSAKNCFLRAELIDHIPFLKVKTWFNNEIVEFSTQLTGSYNFENIAAAACTGYYFGVDQLLIKEAIDNYIPKNNRSQVIEKGTNKIILDAYNANPSSMMASISNFLDYPDPNKTIIIGDMLELGNYSVTEHQSIVDFIKNIGFVRIILVGDHFGSTSRTSEIISLRNVKELEDYLIDNPIKNNLILLKGSRGIQLEKALASI
jgi:UDP-N-acetylmuramoyl-tripeptide--D-alanyl-D-alanine ligase